MQQRKVANNAQNVLKSACRKSGAANTKRGQNLKKKKRFALISPVGLPRFPQVKQRRMNGVDLLVNAVCCPSYSLHVIM